jgi:hypothetical protein
MTTAKELNAALANGVKYADDDGDETYPFQETVSEESDLNIGELGILEYVDSFRDKDEPDSWVTLFKHEGLLYAVYAYYDSWNGITRDDINLYPVKQITKTVVDYVKREEA